MKTFHKRGEHSISKPTQCDSSEVLFWRVLGLGIVFLVLAISLFAFDPWGLFGSEPKLSAAASINSNKPTPVPRPSPVAVVPIAADMPADGAPLALPAPAEATLVAIPETTPEPQPLPAEQKPIPGRVNKVLSVNELRRQLDQMPEFGLTAPIRDRLVELYKNNYQSSAAMGRRPSHDPSILLTRLPNASQLPIRPFPNCQLNQLDGELLGALSRKLHLYLDTLAPKDANGKRTDPKRVRTALRQEWRGKPPEWLRPEALPAMIQILMAEDVPLRLILVDMMADIPGKAASIRLAHRAIYDLSLEVRKAAIDALSERPRTDARRTLVQAMQYPWPPAADHAADALAALADRDAAPLLVALLDKPDPCAPFATKTGASVRELVRVNHVENCLLCHVPAVGRDPVTDVDPFARRPTQTYQVGSYSGPQLPGNSGGGVWSNRVLIRADVQFLRQDFSIMFPPGGAFASTGGQRFDFLVRKRPLKPEDAEIRKTRSKQEATSYPQREAVLYALRAVTGEDVGSTTAAWLKLYPDAVSEAEGVRISDSLRTGSPEQREQLFARYRDAKEGHFTEGLAHAIPHLTPKLKEKVRGILVERLTRLPADDLRGHMEDDGEMRRAALRACVRKADPEMLPELIELLADVDVELAESAHQALKRLTGEDFGPPKDGAPNERATAIAKWHDWNQQRTR